jgi:DNA-binding NtrC family response regulator
MRSFAADESGAEVWKWKRPAPIGAGTAERSTERLRYRSGYYKPQASEGRLGGASIASLEKRITRADVEGELIQQTLKRNLGRISSAAAELGVSRPTLYELMEKLGIARWEQIRSASLHLAMTTS